MGVQPQRRLLLLGKRRGVDDGPLDVLELGPLQRGLAYAFLKLGNHHPLLR
jgi:hypothetical protein